MIHYFQIATVPPGARIDAILPGREGLWDTGAIMFSLRRDDFGRLLVGTMGRTFGAESGLSANWAKKQIARIFPTLGAVDIEKAWHGQIAMTPDHLPRILQLDDGVYTPIGYNGRGITTGTVFGQAMAELLDGGDPADLPLPITTLKTVRSAPLLERFYGAVFAANQMLRGF